MNILWWGIIWQGLGHKGKSFPASRHHLLHQTLFSQFLAFGALVPLTQLPPHAPDIAAVTTKLNCDLPIVTTPGITLLHPPTHPQLHPLPGACTPPH
jgi:hypothetical protein